MNNNNNNNNNNKFHYDSFLTVASAITSCTMLRNSRSSYIETDGKTILSSVSPSTTYRVLFTYGFPYLTTLSVAHITYIRRNNEFERVGK